MITDLLLLRKKNTDTRFEQTERKPQETHEIKLNKQIQTFSFSPSSNFSDEGKGLLAVTGFEPKNCGSCQTDVNNTFSSATLVHWTSNGGKKTMNKLQILLKLRSQNDIEKDVKEVTKKEIKAKSETMNKIYLILILVNLR